MDSVNQTVQLGDSYNVIGLDQFGGECKLENRTIRALADDEVLVKVQCATIHPADMFFLKGVYGSSQPNPPLVPGFEGSGEVVQVGKNVDRNLIGVRCAIASNPSTQGPYQGVWGQ